MYKNVEKQILKNEKDKIYNESILLNNKLEPGATSRILESKGKLSKGSQKYSVDTYKIIGRDGNCFTVQDSEGENWEEN